MRAVASKLSQKSLLLHPEVSFSTAEPDPTTRGGFIRHCTAKRQMKFISELAIQQNKGIVRTGRLHRSFRKKLSKLGDKRRMKNLFISSCLMLSLLTSCSADRLAILIRQYNSGTLITEKEEDLERKIASAKKQFASDRKKEILILYIEGLIYEKRKNYATALNIFKEITEVDRSILDVWLHIAQINSLLNKNNEARKAYLTCLEIINKEILYIEKNKWPDNHILLDDHVKYAFRYSMIDNSYFPLKQTGKISGAFDYTIIKENLLRLKTHIKNSLEQIR